MPAPDPVMPRCPICGEPAAPGVAPFCSTRHRDRDLLQWLGEGYRLPGPRADDDAIRDGAQDGLDKPWPHD